MSPKRFSWSDQGDTILRTLVQEDYRLSIEMTQQARRGGRRKGRKRVHRGMKKLVGVVRAHAQRHRQLLDEQWEKTEWTRAQAEQILRPIDGVLELLPQAQKQAHERIIGERSVAGNRSILTLHGLSVRVMSIP